MLRQYGNFSSSGGGSGVEGRRTEGSFSYSTRLSIPNVASSSLVVSSLFLAADVVVVVV